MRMQRTNSLAKRMSWMARVQKRESLCRNACLSRAAKAKTTTHLVGTTILVGTSLPWKPRMIQPPKIIPKQQRQTTTRTGLKRTAPLHRRRVQPQPTKKAANPKMIVIIRTKIQPMLLAMTIYPLQKLNHLLIAKNLIITTHETMTKRMNITIGPLVGPTTSPLCMHPTTTITSILPNHRTKKGYKSHPSQNHHHHHRRRPICDSIDAVVHQ